MKVIQQVLIWSNHSLNKLTTSVVVDCYSTSKSLSVVIFFFSFRNSTALTVLTVFFKFCVDFQHSPVFHKDLPHDSPKVSKVSKVGEINFWQFTSLCELFDWQQRDRAQQYSHFSTLPAAPAYLFSMMLDLAYFFIQVQKGVI